MLVIGCHLAGCHQGQSHLWLGLLSATLVTNPRMTTASYIDTVPSAPASKCLVSYRLFTSVEKLKDTTSTSPSSICVSEAIEKVEIVQMDNGVMSSSETEGKVLDITVTCQGR